ncbi:hypothetical protein WISP_36967 [Willisornis vidua]|uniref:Uncharacterized protein n=1 Tax=Willisornis vidua TaxID=1566151 RepID=A0ABQ9DJJ9_9PASS|nr:hypothetical protein WISP_36967 [Willisornis vidua]
MVNVLPVLETPGLDAELQLGSHKSRAEGQDCIAGSAGHTALDANQVPKDSGESGENPRENSQDRGTEHATYMKKLVVLGLLSLAKRRKGNVTAVNSSIKKTNKKD